MRTRDGLLAWPWLALLALFVLLGGARGHAWSVEPEVRDATDAGADAALSVRASLEGLGAQASLLLTWTNQGRVPLLLFTHVDTDAGTMFDAIEIRQGMRHATLKSPRKAAAPRFCLLPAGSSHAVRVQAIQSWVARLGFEPGQAWQVDYVVPAHVQAPLPETTALCGGGQITGGGPAEPAARLWHGRAQGALLRL